MFYYMILIGARLFLICPEMGNFYSEIVLELTFWTTLQNLKHQLPSSVCYMCEQMLPVLCMMAAGADRLFFPTAGGPNTVCICKHEKAKEATYIVNRRF